MDRLFQHCRRRLRPGTFCRAGVSALLLAAVAASGQPALPGAVIGRPLSARSGPRGATMFTLLAPADTGIVTENRYADPRMWGDRYQEFSVGPMGTGIAIGDYDADGRPDLFVVSKTETCRLFRNLGDWKFADVTAQAGLLQTGPAAAEWKQGAAFVDVNNDGRLDLYVCRFNAPNWLYINQGDGTFKEEAAARGIAITDSSGMACFCDYDRDGWLDVYLQTNLLDAAAHPMGQRDYLFRNNGDGRFTDVTARAGITGETQGHSATWWDYDNDGWPDLYVANDFAAPDRLYHNNRDGTFADTLGDVVPHTPFSSMGADLGDVNNDGLIDLFVADMAGTTHNKDQRGMADSRARGRESYDSGGETPQYLRNAVYLNTGTGRVLEAAWLLGLPATDWTWSPRFEDLDNDGLLDLHVTNGMNREQHNSDLLIRMMGAESAQERARIMRSSPVLAEANLAYRNLGDLRFENVGAAWGLDQNGVSFGSAFGDFDGDGDLDLVYGNYQGGVSVLRNDSETGHRLVVELRGTRSNRFGVGATVELGTAAGIQVRQLVLARGYLSTSEPIVHFGLGAVEKIDRLKITWPSGQQQMFRAVSADQRLTITEPAEATPSVPLVEPAPRIAFAEIGESAGLALSSRETLIDETVDQPFLPFRFNARGPALSVGDLNGDGRDDLVVGGTPQDPTRILIRNDHGGFDRNVLPAGVPVALNDGPIAVFDANGDGANDLLVTKGGVALPPGSPDYQPKLFFNDGHGNFQPAADDALPVSALSAGATAVADFDRDGQLDVFIGARVLPGQYPLSPASALLANRGGRFVDVTDAVAPGLKEIGMVTSAVWTDLDEDGWLDLVVSLEWGGVRYWHNEAGRALVDRSEAAGFSAAGSGWWTSLAAADFNGDGRPDLVAGNVGLNTQYEATAAHPALLFYGEFRDGGSPEIIEAHYDGDRLVPWRTRKQLGARLPALLKRFPKNDAYARASLGDILGEERLAAAQRFAAQELRSGVFLSQTNGSYRFQPLPRIAQIAPLQGIVATDFNGDGHADILAVQNSYAPVYLLGHFDGGLGQVLLGDGHGNFEAIPPRESRLVVPGDAKALAITDLEDDGRPDFVVTRNNATSLAYRNLGSSGHHSLRIALRGAAGNRSAIGAQVVVDMADGTAQSAEVYAGSGYLSQSSPALFFGYTDAAVPQRVRVRWPNGTTTDHPVESTAVTLTIEAALH